MDAEAIRNVRKFEQQVERSIDHDRWTGATNPSRGTGRLKVSERQITAHRYAWELVHGLLPAGGRVLACPEEPRCVRLEHLTTEGVDSQGLPEAARSEGGHRQTTRRAARGSGSKRRRGQDSWELTVTTGIDDQGRPLRSFRTFRGTGPEATKALAVFVAEVEEAGPIRTDAGEGALTVQRLVNEFRSHLEDDKGRRPTTMVRYEGLQRKWVDPHLGAKRAGRMMPSELDSVLGRMRRAGQSQSSIHQTRTLLNGAFKWAKRNRRVSFNPCVDIEEPKASTPSREVLPPEVDMVRRIVAAAYEFEFDFGVACQLVAVTGMRRGEIAGLRWNRLHLDEAYLVVAGTVSDAAGRVVINEFTKTRRTRRVSLDTDTIAAFVELRERQQTVASAAGVVVASDGFVFSRTPGGATPLRPDLLSRRMQRLRDQLGIDGAEFDATFQAIRHWTQTVLSEAGYNSRQVALRGGHSEQLMNRVYVHRTNTAEAEMTAYLGDLLT